MTQNNMNSEAAATRDFLLVDFLVLHIYCHNKSHYQAGKDFSWYELAKKDKLGFWNIVGL